MYKTLITLLFLFPSLVSAQVVLKENQIISSSTPKYGVVMSDGIGTSTLSASSSPAFTSFIATSTTATSTISGNLNVVGNIQAGKLIVTGTFSITGIGTSMIVGTDTAGNLVATSTPTAAAYLATSTTATSTFKGGITGPNLFTVQSNSGKVGVGTSTPVATLNVTNSTGSSIVRIERTGLNAVDFGLSGGAVAADALDLIVSPVATASFGYQFQTNNGSSFIKALNISNAGNIGIGTTTPDAHLTVQSTGNVSGISLNTSATGNTRIFDVGQVGNDGYLAISGSGGTTNVSLSGFATTASYINSFLGVGITTPTANLTVSRSYAEPTGGIASTTLAVFSNNNAANATSTISILSRSSASSVINFGTEVTESAASIRYGQNSVNTTLSGFGFYVGSSDRMHITTPGNVGIGTTTPTTKLTVYGGGTGTTIATAYTNSTALFTTANSALSLAFGYSSADSNYIQALNSSNGAGDELLLNPFGGNVGIGTTTPDSKLQIDGLGTYGALKLSNAANTTSFAFMGIAASASSLINGTSAGDLAIVSNSSGKINFSANNGTTDHMVITNAGNVGIGTTSPSGLFTVSGSNNATSLTTYQTSPNITLINRSQTVNSVTPFDFRMTNSSGTELSGVMLAGVMTDPTAASEDMDLTFSNMVAGTFNEKMRLKGARLGIGTSSPNALLEVYRTDGGVVGRFQANTSTANTEVQSLVLNRETTGTADVGLGAQLGFEVENSAGATNSAGNIAVTYPVAGVNSYDMNFRLMTAGSAGQEKLTIKGATGFVGIGTTSPSGRLDVYGAAPVSVITDTTGLVANSGGKFSFYNQYNTAGSLQPYATIQGIRENANTASNSGALLFYVGANGSGGTLPEVMRITSAGFAGIGTSTPQSLLHVYGTTPMISLQTNGSGNMGFTAYNSTFNKIGEMYVSGLTGDATINPLNVTGILVKGTTGNTGIGTTTPAAKLDVFGAPGSAQLARIEGSSATTNTANDFAYLSLYNTNTTANNYTSLYFDSNDSVGSAKSMAAIQAIYTSHTAGAYAGDLTFLTSTGGALAEKMRITGAGLVGIGVSTPTQQLTIKNTGLIGWDSGAGTASLCLATSTITGAMITDCTAQTGAGTAPAQRLSGNMYTSTATTTVNTANETSLFTTTSLGTTTVPANFLKVGKHFYLHGRGQYSTPLGNVETVTGTLKFGATTMGSVTTAQFPASATNQPFKFDADCTLQAIGATGSMVCDGELQYQTVLSGTNIWVTNDISSVGPRAVNTTLKSNWDVTADWSATAFTTQSIQVTQAWIEMEN